MLFYSLLGEVVSPKRYGAARVAYTTPKSTRVLALVPVTSGYNGLALIACWYVHHFGK